MSEIEDSAVDAVCQEVGRLAPWRIPIEMGKAGAAQPELLAFILESTEGMAPGVNELAGFIYFVVWRTFRRETKGELPKVTSDAIQKRLERNEQELARLDDVDIALIDTATYRQVTTQPALFRYMLETLAAAEENEDQPLAIPAEDKASLMILLMTAIDLLDEARDNAH